MRKGDDIASAREVVAHLAVHFLATGERLKTGRLRTRDVVNGRRVTVWFSEMGFDLGTCRDETTACYLGLATIYVPR